MNGFLILNVLSKLVSISQGDHYFPPAHDKHLVSCTLIPLQPVLEYEYYQTGDVIIGGLVSVHSLIQRMKCSDGVYAMRYYCDDLNVDEYASLLTIIFAVEEINKDPNFLPNMTLGYHLFDTCGYNIKAIHSIIQILSGYRRNSPNYSGMEIPEVAGFVGDTTFLPTFAAAEFLNIYHYTQISHRVNDPLLNDRAQFPNFYSTIHSSRVWYEMVIRVLGIFRWNWIGIIVSCDGTGETELQELRKEMTRHGICIEFIIYLSKNEDLNRQRIIDIKRSTTNVVVVCGHFIIEYIVFFEELNALRKNITFILNESWNVFHYPDIVLRETFNCSLKPLYPYRYIHGLEYFIDTIHPSKRPADPLLEEIWLINFNCPSSDEYKNKQFELSGLLPNVTCTGTESFPCQISNDHYRKLYFIYTAVYALAHALKNMKLSKNKSGNFGLRQKVNVFPDNYICSPR